MNYLSELPSELSVITYSNLRYKDIKKLEKNSNNYEEILKIKYPGFYHIINTIKRENNSYKNYSWETAFELIDRIERFLQNIEDESEINYDLRESNPEIIMDILLYEFDFGTYDITAAYSISSSLKNHKYHKFLKEMPIIKDINTYLLEIFYGDVELEEINNEVEYLKDCIEAKFVWLDNESDVRKMITYMLYAFLLILDEPNSYDNLKNTILSLNFYEMNIEVLKRTVVMDLIMIHNYIVDYFEK